MQFIIHKDKYIKESEMEEYIRQNIHNISSLADFTVYNVHAASAFIESDEIKFFRGMASAGIRNERDLNEYKAAFENLKKGFIKDIEEKNDEMKKVEKSVNSNLNFKSIDLFGINRWRDYVVNSMTHDGLKVLVFSAPSYKNGYDIYNSETGGVKKIIENNMILKFKVTQDFKKTAELTKKINKIKQSSINNDNFNKLSNKMKYIEIGDNKLLYKYVKKENKFLLIHLSLAGDYLNVCELGVLNKNGGHLDMSTVGSEINCMTSNLKKTHKVVNNLIGMYLDSKLNNSF